MMVCGLFDDDFGLSCSAYVRGWPIVCQRYQVVSGGGET